MNSCVKGKTIMTKQDLVKELDSMYSNALMGETYVLIN